MPVGIARLNVCVCICGQLLHPLLFFSLLSIFWIFQTFWIFYCKSSDLFMINPHFSLNPRNSWISSAILRFHEDFHSEIHGFHEQSSDLREDFTKSLPDLRVHSSALSESQCFVSLSSQNCVMCSIESWTFNWAIYI